MDINLTNIPPKGQGTFPLPLRYPSLRQSLESYLSEIIPLRGVGSIFRRRSSEGILYRCPINKELSPDFEQFLAIFLKKIDSMSLKAPDASLPALLFEVHWGQPGWLNLGLSDEQLPRWLTYIWQSAEFMNHPTYRLVEAVQDDFPLQYAHACCWTAIRQGQAAGVGRRQEGGIWGEEADIQWCTVLNLVNSNGSFFGSSLRLDALTRSLIHLLVEFVDHQDCSKRTTLILIGRQLGHAALEYLRYGSLREVLASSELGQARWGLVILVQQSLQWLLEARCGVIARREL